MFFFQYTYREVGGWGRVPYYFRLYMDIVYIQRWRRLYMCLNVFTQKQMCSHKKYMCLHKKKLCLHNVHIQYPYIYTCYFRFSMDIVYIHRWRRLYMCWHTQYMCLHNKHMCLHNVHIQYPYIYTYWVYLKRDLYIWKEIYNCIGLFSYISRPLFLYESTNIYIFECI